MRKKIVFVFVLALSLSPSIFAQIKPAWIDSVETTLKQNGTLKLETKSERNARDYFEYNFELKSDKFITNVQIQILKDDSNVEKRFAETVENLTNGMGRFSTRTRINDLGEEAYKWVNVNKDGWTMIRFRKKAVFVEIFSLSEKLAKSFAEDVSEQVPGN
ncbi:MAG TPA: hypothetical protein VGC76_16715 [Pyrinomonadaceae bacterium]|jgi:hypothetical protein